MVCMASIGLSLPSTSLRKLDRLASEYFNSCLVVFVFWLLVCLGFRFFVTVTLEFLFCFLICLHGCLDEFKMKKYFQNRHAHDGLQRTEL